MGQDKERSPAKASSGDLGTGSEAAEQSIPPVTAESNTAPSADATQPSQARWADIKDRWAILNKTLNPWKKRPASAVIPASLATLTRRGTLKGSWTGSWMWPVGSPSQFLSQNANRPTSVPHDVLHLPLPRLKQLKEMFLEPPATHRLSGKRLKRWSGPWGWDTALEMGTSSRYKYASTAALGAELIGQARD